MSLTTFQCEHICRNSCEALSRALQLETSIVRLTEEAIQQCDDADIKNFLTGVAETSSETTLRILQKLNEVQARSQILDGIASSFNPSHNQPPEK
ncbi:MAG: hypothetical protein PHP42_08290 [Bacteroidota bacterium]|nr:hypothetical protein [Bacteroidota bacterium]